MIFLASPIALGGRAPPAGHRSVGVGKPVPQMHEQLVAVGVGADRGARAGIADGAVDAEHPAGRRRGQRAHQVDDGAGREGEPDDVLQRRLDGGLHELGGGDRGRGVSRVRGHRLHAGAERDQARHGVDVEQRQVALGRAAVEVPDPAGSARRIAQPVEARHDVGRAQRAAVLGVERIAPLVQAARQLHAIDHVGVDVAEVILAHAWPP